MSARLTRLKINRFRDTKPTELHFSAGFNVLLGLNGTGKTTLLDLIAAICSDDLSPYAKEAFDVEYEVLYSEPAELLAVHVWWEANEGDEPGKYEFRVAIGAMVWTNGSTYGSGSTADGVAQLVGTPSENSFVLRLVTMSRLPSPQLGGWFAAIQGTRIWPVRMDEGLWFFHQLLGEEPTAFAFMFREEWLKASEDSAYGSWNGTHLEWLAEAIRMMGFDSIEFSVSVGPTGVPVLKNFAMRLPGRGWVDSERLSFGQKRLFAFHCRLAVMTHWGTSLPFIADELSNGLHHAWIQHCMEKLEGMQSFLSAQGPLVLDKLPWGSAAELQKMFVRCERQGASILWRNLTEEEALELHLSGEQGYEKTSETLKRQGLW